MSIFAGLLYCILRLEHFVIDSLGSFGGLGRRAAPFVFQVKGPKEFCSRWPGWIGSGYGPHSTSVVFIDPEGEATAH